MTRKFILVFLIALLYVPLNLKADPQADFFKAAEAEISKKTIMVNGHWFGCDFNGVLIEYAKMTYNVLPAQVSEIDQMNGITWHGGVQFMPGPTRAFDRTNDGTKVVPRDWHPSAVWFLMGQGEVRNGKATQSFQCESYRRPTSAEMKLIAAATGLSIPDTLSDSGSSTKNTNIDQPKGSESTWVRPGTAEATDVERADKEINAVYEKLMGTLGQDKQKRLREAQRTWLKSRDTEADRIAREGGAVGGSALRVDSLNARAKLTRERTEVLRGYLKEPETIP